MGSSLGSPCRRSNSCRLRGSRYSNYRNTLPLEGGHYLIDVFAGILIAIVCIITHALRVSREEDFGREHL
jgi:hypothetical protein